MNMAKNNKGKKEFAPTIKLWESRNGGTFSGSITEKSIEKIQEVLSRVEVGGKIMVKPVSEAYREAAGDNAPAYEITIFTAAEQAEFNAKREQEQGI
jgi:hypothetical protein